MSYADAVTRGAPIAIRRSTYCTGDKSYAMIPLGLAVFLGDGPESELDYVLQDMRRSYMTRAWTGGKVNLSNEEIEGMSEAQVRESPLTGPLLLLPRDPEYADLPDDSRNPTAPSFDRENPPPYRFVHVDPADMYGFVAANRVPTAAEIRAVDGQIVNNPPSGVHSRISEGGGRKMNARAILNISPVGKDGKASLEMVIGADLFTFWGLLGIGAWARAGQNLADVIATLRVRKGNGTQWLEEQVHEEMTGGYYGTTLKFSHRLDPGATYEMAWTCTKYWTSSRGSDSNATTDTVQVISAFSFTV
ncbi:hypothetical protein ACFYZ4_32405 [Streptomyces sp. NPDC001513]|uniref:hypothetical protein n=1 Tax=Streptomyces sp. NPDC001513 TaxID=3364580 RepID=UPI00369AB318